MWSSLELNGYRSWSKLTLPSLARVNVLVGRNGAGKTTVLEAVEALASRTLGGLLSSPTRREEIGYTPGQSGGYSSAPSIASLFTGRNVRGGREFRIVAVNEDRAQAGLSVVLHAAPPETKVSPTLELPALAAFVTWAPSGPDITLGLSAEGLVQQQSKTAVWVPPPPFRYITARSLPAQGAAQVFAPLAGTSKEDAVVRALQIVSPRLERIVVGSNGAPILGLFARIADVHERVPLGSLGDGVLRMLVLASELANASGGVLLVDEIESGLHVSVMSDLWRMIIRTAAEADVQVFATTHSDDCLRGLASLFAEGASEADQSLGPSVCVYRLDPGVEQATRYDAASVQLALESGMEIRG